MSKTNRNVKDRCLYGFIKEDLIIKHKEDWFGINKSSTRIEMPTKSSNHISLKQTSKLNVCSICHIYRG